LASISPSSYHFSAWSNECEINERWEYRKHTTVVTSEFNFSFFLFHFHSIPISQYFNFSYIYKFSVYVLLPLFSLFTSLSLPWFSGKLTFDARERVRSYSEMRRGLAHIVKIFPHYSQSFGRLEIAQEISTFTHSTARAMRRKKAVWSWLNLAILILNRRKRRKRRAHKIFQHFFLPLSLAANWLANDNKFMGGTNWLILYR
jgi:hypothetical protein